MLVFHLSIFSPSITFWAHLCLSVRLSIRLPHHIILLLWQIGFISNVTLHFYMLFSEWYTIIWLISGCGTSLSSALFIGSVDGSPLTLAWMETGHVVHSTSVYSTRLACALCTQPIHSIQQGAGHQVHVLPSLTLISHRTVHSDNCMACISDMGIK